MKYTMSIQLLMAMVAVTIVSGFPAEPPITFSTTTAKTPLNPDHVPDTVCESMQPKHCTRNGVCFEPSNAEPPYEIVTSSRKVAPGGTIQVTVQGIDGAEYKGIYIQGRINDKPVGEFEDPNKIPEIVVSNCPGGKWNAASYISNIKAVNKVTLNWTAPKTHGGEVIFKATIVKTFAEFWAQVPSESVKIEASGTKGGV